MLHFMTRNAPLLRTAPLSCCRQPKCACPPHPIPIPALADPRVCLVTAACHAQPAPRFRTYGRVAAAARLGHGHVGEEHLELRVEQGDVLAAKNLGDEGPACRHTGELQNC